MPQTIFITGASVGIGLACAKVFYEHGWNVVATMRNPEAVVELKALDTTRMLVLSLDLQAFDSIPPAVDAAIAKFSNINVLLNNAGFGQLGIFKLLSREQVQAQFNVNLFGHMDVTRVLLPHMRAVRRGTVINVSSCGGFLAFPMASLYTASKFALEGWTESLAFELAAVGITVKRVVPYGAGISDTNFLPTAMGAMAGMDLERGADYVPFVQGIGAQFATLGGGPKISAADVAQVVYGAATDRSDKLRYFTGIDTGDCLKARYESKSDEEYIAHMRSFSSLRLASCRRLMKERAR